MSRSGGAITVQSSDKMAGRTAWRRIPDAVRGAWRVLCGRPCPCPVAPVRRCVPPMATAVALTTECSRPDGPAADVVNALLVDTASGDMPAVATAAAILAATLGRLWAEHEASGPAEVLSSIGLVVSRRDAR